MNTRIKNALLIVLLVLNVTFIGGWWFMHMHAHKHMMISHMQMTGDKGMQFLEEKLNFNEDQKVKLEAMWKEHSAKMQVFHNKMMTLEKQNLNYIMQDNPDSVHAFSNIDSVDVVMGQIHKELFRHFGKVRALCTAEQKTKFDEIAKHIMSHSPGMGDHDGRNEHDSL